MSSKEHYQSPLEMSYHSVLFPQQGDCPNDHNNILADHFPNSDNLNHSEVQSLAP